MRTQEQIHFADSKLQDIVPRLVQHDAQRHENEDTGPPITLAVAGDIQSKIFRNLYFPTFEAAARTCAGIVSVKSKEESFAHTAGILQHDGQRIASSIAGFQVIGLDYDKGFADCAVLHQRLTDLDLMGASWPSFNDGITKHSLAFDGTKLVLKTGKIDPVTHEFCKFCDGRKPTDALAQQFAIEREHYNPAALGEVKIVGRRTEKCGYPVKIVKNYFDLSHGPIPKARLFIAIDPFMRGEHESLASFKARWGAFYNAVAGLIGVPCDHSCATLERAFYGITYNAASAEPPAPQIHRGKILAPDDPRLICGSISFDGCYPTTSHGPRLSGPPRAPAHKLIGENERKLRRLWQGFRAADAAATLYPEHVTDKRAEKGLVAIDCPFIEEHATSNKPGTRQCALYNSNNKHGEARARCFADSCRDRPSEDFFEALFTPATRHEFR